MLFSQISFLSHTEHEHLLHMLDVKQSLLFNLDRTKALAAIHHVLLTYAPHHCGLSVSSKCFSRWITAIILCYQLEKFPCRGD